MEMAPAAPRMAVAAETSDFDEEPVSEDQAIAEPHEEEGGLPGFSLNLDGDLPTDGGGRSSSDDDGSLEEEDPFAKIAELMMSSAPEPIPGVFASPEPKPAPRRKGAVGLWVLLAVMVVGSLGAGLYFFQDRVIDMLPGSAHLFEQVGARNEVVGAGLTFRNYNSERMNQDQTEVLIVRGVIANTTDQPREIPLLKLALYNDDKLLQKKVISPPQTMLDANGTVGFRITLEQPNPDASRFEVTFTSAKGPE